MLLCVFRAYDYNKKNSYRLKHLHKISVKNIADATKQNTTELGENYDF